MKYPAGTRYSDSVIYDEATDEVIEGFQVFRQCNPDGTPTGRKSILVPTSTGGNLVGTGLAADMRQRAMRQAAPELLATLREAELVLAEKLRRLGADPAVSPTTHRIRAAIEQAAGIQN